MTNLLFYPDVDLIILLSVIFVLLTFLLGSRKFHFKQLIFNLLLAILLTLVSPFIYSQRFCGTEICFYHGWPHFLYISYGSPTFNIIQTLSFPIYFLVNILFYFSLFSLVEVLIKKVHLKRN